MPSGPEILVLHVGFNPSTGVLRVIQSLLSWTERQSGLAAAAGVFAQREWPLECRSALEGLGLPFFLHQVPSFPGANLLQLFACPLTSWVKELHDTFRPKNFVVHLHHGPLSGIYLPVKARLDCPMALVSTFHGGVYEYLPAWKQTAFRFLARRLRRFGLNLTAVNRQDIPKYTRLFAIPAKRFRVIPNGVEDKGLRGCPRLTDPSAPLTVGFMGVLDNNKGWDLTGQAVEQLYQEGQPVTYLMAGRGPDSEAAAAWAKDRPFVRFLGFVPNAGENLMPRFDVLVAPSIVEGAPMSIIEALSCGVPVIATAVGGVPDMIDHGYNGFLIERTSAAIAGCLHELVRDVERHRRMSQAASKVFLERFEINRIGCEYITFYKEILAREHPFDS
ncbi:MAG: glycosyltransferase family 4 protein [Desulfobaccales bacterium]